MSRRITRSQQRKQDLEVERVRVAGARIGDGSSINGDGGFSGSCVNGVESVEGTPRKGRATKRQKLAAVAVVVEKAPEEKAATFNGGVSENEELQEEGAGPKVKEGKIEEKNDKQKEKEEKTENKTLNGVVKGAHKKFSEGEEEPMRGVVETVVMEVEKPVEVNGGDATNTNKGSSEDQSDDDDDAPEAVSISTGRQAILAREEEIKKAREQQESQARLKRKTHDARLKDQKAASQFQPPPSKRQKLSAPSQTAPAPSNDTPFGPTNTAITTATTTATPSAEPPSPGGLLSPTSSTTLSLQQPPTDPSHPLNLILAHRSSDSAPPRTYTKKIPLLLPPSLLNEVALLPPTPPPSTASTKASTTKPLNTRKTLADFEAEEKAALEAIEKKKSKQLQKLPAYKKGPVHVAVLGKEEQRERDRRVMAPPRSKKVGDVRDNWLMGRKLVGGERRAVPGVGGKGFVRRK